VREEKLLPKLLQLVHHAARRQQITMKRMMRKKMRKKMRKAHRGTSK
jgi:hypothetical protein